MKREDTLKAARRLLDEQEITPRGNTAFGRRQPHRTMRVTSNLPGDLVDDLDALAGTRSHHIELAIRFYLELKKAR